MNYKERAKLIQQTYDANRMSVTLRNEWIAGQKYEAVAWIGNIDYHALGSTKDEAMEHLEAYISARIANPYGEYRI